MTRTSSLMRSSSCSSSKSPLFTRSSTTFGLSVRIIFASIRCLTVWRARYPTYSREKIIDLLWNIAHGWLQNASVKFLRPCSRHLHKLTARTKYPGAPCLGSETWDHSQIPLVDGPAHCQPERSEGSAFRFECLNRDASINPQSRPVSPLE